jgi:mono/diheme cytochrome c family protein
MKMLWMAALFTTTAALTLALKVEKPPPGDALTGQENQRVTPKLSLHSNRTSPDDLKLSGDLPGSSAYAGRYVARSELLKLQQVTFTVTDDPNFRRKVEISGVYLEEILRAFDIPGKSTLVAAICDDGYEAHYPVEYRAAHHPILVLTVNGKPLALTRRTGDDGSYGPYLISHPSFTSRYQTLAHPEEAQIPNGVLELRFVDEKKVFGVISPQGTLAASSPQMQGYLIAQENCFRCHNAGAYGGHKAGVPWNSLIKMANTKPEYFKAYIKDPQTEDGYAQMPAFPDYDEATLAALTAYFQVAPVNKGSK